MHVNALPIRRRAPTVRPPSGVSYDSVKPSLDFSISRSFQPTLGAAPRHAESTVHKPTPRA